MHDAVSDKLRIVSSTDWDTRLVTATKPLDIRGTKPLDMRATKVNNLLSVLLALLRAKHRGWSALESLRWLMAQVARISFRYLSGKL